jgi:hypothetical protein
MLLLVVRASADEGSAAKVNLRLVSLPAGFRISAFGSDPEKAMKTALYKDAMAAGIDLLKDPDPALEVAYTKGRLFHLFYNMAEIGDPECTFMVQRVHKRVINYKALDDAEPETIDTYSVEGFKCVAGKLKRPDQHNGSFAIGKHAKRVIEKTLEVGVPIDTYADNQGKWPYDANILFKQITKDAPDRAAFEEVQFKSVAKWTFFVSFDADGNYSLTAPELGIKVVRECPKVATPIVKSRSQIP